MFSESNCEILDCEKHTQMYVTKDLTSGLFIFFCTRTLVGLTLKDSYTMGLF